MFLSYTLEILGSDTPPGQPLCTDCSIADSVQKEEDQLAAHAQLLGPTSGGRGTPSGDQFYF